MPSKFDSPTEDELSPSWSCPCRLDEGCHMDIYTKHLSISIASSANAHHSEARGKDWLCHIDVHRGGGCCIFEI